MNEELEYILGSPEEDGKNEKENNRKEEEEEIPEAKTEKKKKTQEIARDLAELLQKVASTGRKLVLIIDGLDKMDKASKIGKVGKLFTRNRETSLVVSFNPNLSCNT